MMGLSATVPLSAPVKERTGRKLSFQAGIASTAPEGDDPQDSLIVIYGAGEYITGSAD